MNTKRLLFLDFLRFVAISVVILHHCFAIIREEFGVFSNQAAYKIIENHGAWGVKLFFAVSGYIIFNKYSENIPIKKFMFLRVTRLWPMLFLSITISLFLVQIQKFKLISTQDIIPSLLMIEPQVFNTIFSNLEFSWIDNSYWSLFVEIRYYFIYALIIQVIKFNSINRLFLLIILFFTSQVAYILGAELGYEKFTSAIFWLFIPDYMGFFLIGIIVHSIVNPANSVFKKFISCLYLMLLVFVSMVRIQVINPSFGKSIYLSEIALICLLFACSTLFGEKNKITFYTATYIGKSSYISYLLHQNLFLFVITFVESPRYVYLNLVIYLILLIAISYILSKTLEPRLITGLRSIFKSKIINIQT